MKLGDYNFVGRCYVVVVDQGIEFYADAYNPIPSGYLDYEVINEDRVTDTMKIYYIKESEKTDEDSDNDLDMIRDFADTISKIAEKYGDSRAIVISGDNEGFKVKFVKK